MAFIDTDSEDAANAPTFYNVTTAVGHGCKNNSEDVKVVQFFLTSVYSTELFKSKKPKGSMTIDGKVGPVTRNWITKFQLDMRDRGNPVYADGIVDKAGNENNADNFVSSIARSTYSVRLLNNVLRKIDAPVYKTLTSNPIVPPDVRMIFSQINAQCPAMNYGKD